MSNLTDNQPNMKTNIPNHKHNIPVEVNNVTRNVNVASGLRTRPKDLRVKNWLGKTYERKKQSKIKRE